MSLAWILCCDEICLQSVVTTARYPGSQPWSQKAGVHSRQLQKRSLVECTLQAAMFGDPGIDLQGSELIFVVGLATGRWAKTKTGDVIVAERVYQFDPDEIRADEHAAAKAAGKVVDSGLKLRKSKKRRLESIDWEEESKRSYELAASGESPGDDEEAPSQQEQLDWMVVAMHRAESGRGPNPITHPERSRFAPDWSDNLKILRERGLVMPRKLAMAPAGHKLAEELGGVIDRKQVSALSYRVHVAPIAGAVGPGSLDDPELFVRLNQTNTKLLSLDRGWGPRAAAWAADQSASVLLVHGISNITGLAAADITRRDAADAIAAFTADYLSRFEA